MGTVAIQNQCCLSKRDDEWEDDEEEGAQEGAAVQLVERVPWHGRSGGDPAGAPPRPPAAVPTFGRNHRHPHGQRVGLFRCT